ncbi:hypothetical protein [Micromonospora violae]|uniref:hypothetical protein n=1 Tax=Micromonospora violae TaxID=1278207 RepID=UPI0033F53972
MAESVASDLAIARLIQKLGGSRRRSTLDEQSADRSHQPSTPAPDARDEPKQR